MLSTFEPEIADRYAERILAETDPVKRRALERESKAVAAERRKGIGSDFGRRQQVERGWNSLPSFGSPPCLRLRETRLGLSANRRPSSALAALATLRSFASSAHSGRRLYDGRNLAWKP